MTEPNNPPPQHLERLLRRWGAEQAVAQEAPGAPPALRPAHRPWPWRWVSVAAAACVACVLSSAALYLASQRSSAHGQAARGRMGPAAILVQPPAATQPDLAETIRQLTVAQAALTDAQQRLLDENRRLAGQLTELRKTFQDDRARLVAAERRAADLGRQLGERQALLAKAVADLETQRKELARLVQQTDRSMQQLHKGRAELADKLAEVARAQAAFNARQAALVSAFQRVYLAARAGEGELAGRQRAIRRNRLLARCARLRPSVRGEQTRKVFDTLEVWLTRVDLAEVDNPADAVSVTTMIDSAALRRQIDQILLAGKEERSVNAWLIECDLLLMGLDRVG